MSATYSIARSIAARGKEMGWKAGTKTADKLNLEAWVGAWIALDALKREGLVSKDQADAVGNYVALVVAPRGYSETILLAERSRLFEAGWERKADGFFYKHAAVLTQAQALAVEFGE